MNRYEVVDIKGSRDDFIIDNVTGRRWQVDRLVSDDICKEMNELSERGDRIIEEFTTDELLKLKWQRDIYQRFSRETMRVLNKYEIDSLEKLDKILFEQRVW